MTASAQDGRVTYQGTLNKNGSLATGVFDFSFTAFDFAVGGASIGNTRTLSAVPVSNGLFTVLLDFDETTFNGSERWLQIAVRTNGGGNFEPLAPRQRVTAAPYAITARNVTGEIPATQLSGTLPPQSLSGIYSGLLTLNNPGNSFFGNGAGLLGVNAMTLQGLGAGSFWQLNGNGGTTAGTHFLGTTDDQPLEVKVNGQRALRVEPTAGTPNLVGGFADNEVWAGIVGATIGGGGESGSPNSIGLGSPNHSTIAGGLGHSIRRASHATISGGQGNSIRQDVQGGHGAAIGGGSFNRIEEAENGVIGGGANNQIEFRGAASTISGGQNNGIFVADVATIGGGAGNRVYAREATIAGGVNNTIWGSDFGTSSFAATIGGGSGNSINHLAKYSTIAGGIGNDIGMLEGQSATVGGGESNKVGHFSGYSTISGGAYNSIDTNCPGGIIAGGIRNFIGREFASVSGGAGNTNIGRYSTIGGGRNNEVGHGSIDSTIGGGASNRVRSPGFYCTINGGSENLIDGAGSGNTIGGGRENSVSASGGGPGNYSTVSGGRLNRISGPVLYGTIGGGVSNTMFAEFAQVATIGGGQQNSILGFYATIGGGVQNSIRHFATASTIGGGANNTFGDSFAKPAKYSTISGGQSNYIAHSSHGTIAGGLKNAINLVDGQPNGMSGASIGGGSDNLVTNRFGTIPGGFQAATTSFAQLAYASGNFASPGDAQTSLYVCRGTTITTNSTELFLDGVKERINVPVDSTRAFDVLVSVRSSTGDSAGFQIRGTVKNNGGTTAIVGAPLFTPIGSDVAIWSVSVAADDTNDALTIRVNGSDGTMVRWVANVRTSEVGF